jgi:hypothetical protein
VRGGTGPFLARRAVRYGPQTVRRLRVTVLGRVIALVVATCVVLIVVDDAFLGPAGLVLALLLLSACADGVMVRAVDSWLGLQPPGERPGPHRARFTRGAPPPSAEVQDEAWRRERERRRRMVA